MFVLSARMPIHPPRGATASQAARLDRAHSLAALTRVLPSQLRFCCWARLNLGCIVPLFTCVLCLAPFSSLPFPLPTSPRPTQAEFHGWLTSNMESGNITRQESVSMLPPLFLDVHPKHLVSLVCLSVCLWSRKKTKRGSCCAAPACSHHLHARLLYYIHATIYLPYPTYTNTLMNPPGGEGGTAISNQY